MNPTSQAITAKKQAVTYQKSSRIPWGKIASYTVLVVFAMVYLGPLLMLVNTSLKTNPAFMRDPIGLASEFQLQNFVEAWEKANFARYLMNSLLYTVGGTTIFILSAIFVAFPIARGYVKNANLLLTMFLIALFLPPALIPQFQLMRALGLYNTQIGYIMLFIVNPIGIVILVNYVKTVPKELDEAAAIDGCGYFRFVVNIVMPLIQPAIATVVVLHAIGIWNEIIAPTIYLTNKEFYPITRGLIVFTGVYGSEWPLLAAAVLLLTAPMLVLFLFLQRYIVSGLTAGSVKG
jgi:raffinose/stachyose/melibiose transport system permease protein